MAINSFSDSPKSVRFNEHDMESKIPSHREYSSLERCSVWYSDKEYGMFALNEVREKMTMPLEKRKEKHESMLRVDNVRRTVLKSQSDQLLRKHMGNDDNSYSQWLARYVERQSEQSSIEARQRGIENDLELLDMKMQEMKSKLPKRPQFSTKIQIPRTNYTKNARWLTTEAKSPKDVAPSAIRRSPVLRKELRKDLGMENKRVGRHDRRN